MAENANHESQTYPERIQGVKSPQSPTTLIINGVERRLVVGKNESLLSFLSQCQDGLQHWRLRCLHRSAGWPAGSQLYDQGSCGRWTHRHHR